MTKTRSLRASALAAAAAILLTGCGTKIQENENNPKPTETVTEAPEQTTAPAATETAPEEPEKPEEAVITPVALPFAEFDQTFEAEDGTLSGKAEVKDEREAFSGKGYVASLDKDSGIELSFEAPESQYYDLSVAVAASKKSVCSLAANAVHIGDITVPEDDKFALVTFSNIYLEKGKVNLAITGSSGSVDVDYAAAKASTEIRDLKLSPIKGTLVNANADANARALYAYLCDNYGKQVLTGQHDTVGTLTETRKIYELTGRNAAIRFGDLMPFTQDMIMGENEIPYAQKWAEEGGIVSYMWHWIDPIGGKSYYSDQTDFDLSKAVTKENIAELSPDELKKLHDDKKISDECYAIVGDIDKISEKLRVLQDSGIAVIWRPLHEASNGYFWWGHDAASYKWLWNLLYQRQTNYHKLNNLIWVWSAQNAGWYVGDKLCDIVSVDIYDKGNLSAHPERLVFLQKISAVKPVAMSECGTTPSIQSIADSKGYWSYIGQWGGSYLLNEDVSFNPEYNKEEDIKLFYSNNLTVTRDELPDLKAAAALIAEEDKKKAEEQKTAEESKKDDSGKADESKKDDSGKADESKKDDSSKADESKKPADSKQDDSKPDADAASGAE